MSKDDFVRNFKIEKALGSNRPFLKKDAMIDLFSCRYRIVDCNLEQVLLEDENGVKIALPRNKVDYLIKKGRANLVGNIMFKSQGWKGQQDKAFSTHADGSTWYKVAPGVWRRADTGTLHSAMGGEKVDPKTHDDKLVIKNIEHKIKLNIKDKAMRDVAIEKMDGYVHENLHYKMALKQTKMLSRTPEDQRHEDHAHHLTQSLKAVNAHKDRRDIYLSQLKGLSQASKEKK